MPKELVWTKNNLIRFWDYWSDRPDDYFAESYNKVIIKLFSNYIKNNATCVDYGCGSGGLVKGLLSKGLQTIAIDHNQKSIEKIINKYNSISNFIGAYPVDQLINNKIKINADIVFSLETIEHVINDDLNNYFSYIKNIMELDSYLILSCPNNEDIERSKIYCPESDIIFHPTQHVRSLNLETLPKLVEPHGFELIDCFSTDLSSDYHYSKKNFIKRKLRILKSKILSYELYSPHLFGVFKKK